MVRQMVDVPMQPVIILMGARNVDYLAQHLAIDICREEHVRIHIALAEAGLKYEGIGVAILHLTVVDAFGVWRMGKELHTIPLKRETVDQAAGIGKAILSVLDRQALPSKPVPQPLRTGEDLNALALPQAVARL